MLADVHHCHCVTAAHPGGAASSSRLLRRTVRTRQLLTRASCLRAAQVAQTLIIAAAVLLHSLVELAGHAEANSCAPRFLCMKSLANTASQVGQTFIIAVAVLLHNLVELAGHAGKDAVTRDGHLFSAYLMLPLATTSLALLHFNWCVTSHSSNSYSSDSIARCTFFEIVSSRQLHPGSSLCNVPFAICDVWSLFAPWLAHSDSPAGKSLTVFLVHNIRCSDRK